MAGLFGDSLDDPRSALMMGLAQGLLGARGYGGATFGDALSAGMGQGMQAYGQARDSQQRRDMLGQQLTIQKRDADLREKDFGLRDQERTLAVEDRQRAAALSAARDRYLQAVAQGHPINAGEAFRVGISVDQTKALVESGNWGRPKVSKWSQVRGPDGRVIEIGLDEYGQPVQGAQLTPFIKPDMLNLGDRQVAVDPTQVQPGQQFGMGISPDTRFSAGVTMRGQNMTDARGREANALKQQELASGGKPPAGYRWAANGALEPIPGGPAAGMNDAQSKANLFGTRAQEADKIINGLAQQGINRPGNIKTALESTPLIGGGLGSLTNWTQSGGQQKVEQAQRDFVNAVLRRESGAVISPDEFDNARKQYFPQLGDSPDVIAQKARNRQIATQGIIAEVPEGRRGVPAAGVKPPPAAISELKLRKADPAARQQFDAVFGPGAADAVLGSQ